MFARCKLIVFSVFALAFFQNCGDGDNFKSIQNGSSSNASQIETDSDSDVSESNEDDKYTNEIPVEEPSDGAQSKDDLGAPEGFGPRKAPYLNTIPKAARKLIQVSTTKQLVDAMSGLQPGDVLVIGQGVYRTTLTFPQRVWSQDKPTVVMADPGSKVIVRASDLVKGWVSQGGGTWVKSNWNINSQQVFVNGQLLQQTGGEIFGDYPTNPNHSLQPLHYDKGGIWPGRIDGNQSNLTLNSFHYSKSKKQIYVKVPATMDLNQQSVEVSIRQHLVSASKVEGLTLSGIQFEHGNTSGISRGAILHFFDCNNNIFQDLTILYADAIGLQVRGNNNLIRNNVVRYAGQTGIGGSGINNHILNNETSYNNIRGFNPNWAAGGMKFIGDASGQIEGSPSGIKDSQVANNLIVYNHSDGFWCDHCLNGGNQLSNNFIAFNEGFGIHMEVSHGNEYFNNVILANGKRGIYLPGTHRSTVVHNLSAFNKLDGIVSIERQRVEPPKNTVVVGNIMAWNVVRSLRMPESPEGHNANHNLYVRKGTPSFSLGWQDGNIVGLGLWRQKSGMGKQSSDVDRAPSKALQNSIDSQSLDLDLSELFKISESYSVPAIQIKNLSLKSGPPGPL